MYVLNGGIWKGKWDINDTSHGVLDLPVCLLFGKLYLFHRRGSNPFAILESYVTIMKEVLATYTRTLVLNSEPSNVGLLS